MARERELLNRGHRNGDEEYDERPEADAEPLIE
jgi:hypothetical protein